MFSRRQQGPYRQLVEASWQRHCTANAQPPKDKIAKAAWYRRELMEATGHFTTKDCDPKRDFEKAMAHFESLAGTGIYWNTRIFGSDKRRIIHAAQKIAKDFDCDEAYLQGIARRALKLDALPALDSLDYADLLIVLRAIKIELRRELDRGQPAQLPVESCEIDEPF